MIIIDIYLRIIFIYFVDITPPLAPNFSECSLHLRSVVLTFSFVKFYSAFKFGQQRSCSNSYVKLWYAVLRLVN